MEYSDPESPEALRKYKTEDLVLKILDNIPHKAKSHKETVGQLLAVQMLLAKALIRLPGEIGARGAKDVLKAIEKVEEAQCLVEDWLDFLLDG